MATQIPQPITHVYKEINEGKYRSVKHYELIKASSKDTLLSELLNISDDRKCAKSSPKYWLQIHDGKKWVKPRLTGLFETKDNNTYKGDIYKRTHLLVFRFFEDKSTLMVYLFRNYFTSDLSKVSHFINR